jgi:hypothetical protein
MTEPIGWLTIWRSSRFRELGSQKNVKSNGGLSDAFSIP